MLDKLLDIAISTGILGLILTGVVKALVSRIQVNEAQTKAVCLGVQALLRDRLYQSYNHYSAQGYAPIYAKENFENMYNQYHSLGVNGVMDEIHDKFKDLPTDPEKGENLCQ